MIFKDIMFSDNEVYLSLYELIESENDDPITYRFNIKTNLNNNIVGQCSFRVGDVDNRHIKYGGNIGYNIDEKYRGNKYSLKACKLLIYLAKLHGMKNVYITCDPENIASIRICDLLGAEFITVLNLPEDDYNFIHNNRTHHYVYRLIL